MSHPQDLAAASAPFESGSNGSTVQSPAQGEPRTINVVAKRFSFEPARIEVAQGERIRLVVTSADGVHGVGISKFKVNQRVPRGGEPVTIDFVASDAGEYPIICSEYCGDGHADMRGMLVVAAKSTTGAPATATPAAEPPAAAQDDDPDRDPNAAQPDFYVATLNTNLPLPRHKGNFRLTHRFLRPLGEGNFGDLAGRLFGLDGGAQIGLDFKYGLVRNFDLGFYRTSDRTIQLSARYVALRDDTSPIGMSVVANVDGTDNFSEEFSPGLALVFSRELAGDRGALYFQPAFINNTRFSQTDGDDYTVTTGVGARLRLGRNSYIFAEGSPRVAGFKLGVTHASFGFEQRYGGHVFQLNFSNGFGTTLAQVARGGTPGDNWYFGFNLARKFY